MYILFILIGILVVIIGLYLLCLKTNKRRSSLMKPFEDTLIAHRGYFDNAGECPENSLAAFDRAVQAGYGIELDVQLTRDGKMVVFHDASLKRMCGVKKKLTSCTYEELQTYRLASSQQKIPLLSQVLDLVNGRVPLVIEVKPEGRFLETTRQLASIMTGYKGIYCMESFHPQAVAWYRKHVPDVPRGQLSTNYWKNNMKQNALVSFIQTNLLLNWYARPDFIAYNHKYANQPSYRLCRRLYHPFNAAWTIRSQEELEKARKTFTIFIFDSFKPKES